MDSLWFVVNSERYSKPTLSLKRNDAETFALTKTSANKMRVAQRVMKRSMLGTSGFDNKQVKVELGTTENKLTASGNGLHKIKGARGGLRPTSSKGFERAE